MRTKFPLFAGLVSPLENSPEHNYDELMDGWTDGWAGALIRALRVAKVGLLSFSKNLFSFKALGVIARIFLDILLLANPIDDQTCKYTEN